MSSVPSALLILDLLGTFAFALNGALTAVRAAHLDIVGIVVLAAVTATGGGILRDVILGAAPPATFSDWRYLTVAAVGGLLVFAFGRQLARLARPIDIFDAAGLSLFAVTGAIRALQLGAGPAQAVVLGAITAVGGGTIRDVLVRRVPTVLSSGLYAVPALIGASLVVLGRSLPLTQSLGAPIPVGAAVVCLVIRLLGLRYGWNAPKPRGPQHVGESKG